METALRIYRRKVGLTSELLGQKLGVRKSTISKWETGRVPAERVLQVESLTGISRQVLRPDLYLPSARAAFDVRSGGQCGAGAEGRHPVKSLEAQRDPVSSDN